MSGKKSLRSATIGPRVSVVLYDGNAARIEDIAAARGLGNATEVINDAIAFRAQLAKYEITEVKLALSLLEQMREIRNEGGRILIEAKGDNVPKQLLILMPS